MAEYSDYFIKQNHAHELRIERLRAATEIISVFGDKSHRGIAESQLYTAAMRLVEKELIDAAVRYKSTSES